jgi:hypothetical protein
MSSFERVKVTEQRRRVKGSLTKEEKERGRSISCIPGHRLSQA